MTQNNLNEELFNIKIALIGDEAVGKSSLFRAYTKNEPIVDATYSPTICDTTDATVLMDGKTILVNLLDTSGSSEYEQLRPISYNGVDIFLIVFSVVNPNSLENIRQWVEECKQYAPDKNIMLVGTKTDLRLDDNTVSKLKQRQLSPLYSTHGENMATEIKAIKYLECSAKDVKSVHRVFEEAIRSISLVPEKRPAHSYTVMEANESFVQQNKRTLSLRLTPFVFAMSRSDPIVLPMSRSDPIDF